MKTPFPGMDPYLEHHALWPSVHTRLMVWLAHQLRPLIRPRYVASVEDRVFIEGPEHQRVPDIWIQRTRAGGPMRTAATGIASPIVLDVEELQIREHYVDILDTYRDLKVVTTIEVISPANKSSGPGRNAYETKQAATLASDVHLVEIDLLRRGRHVLAVPEWHAQALRPYEYLICVNRAPRRTRFEMFPCRLRERLPCVPIPLADKDADVPLDLQVGFEQVYEDGDYALRVRYEEPCVPSLPVADQQWATERWAEYKAAWPDLFPPASAGNGDAAPPHP